MKLGICIYSNDPESVWNAFRFAKLFDQAVSGRSAGVLARRGLRLKRWIHRHLQRHGADADVRCGRWFHQSLWDVCLKLRQSEGSEVCPISTMADLHQLVAECEKVLTF